MCSHYISNEQQAIFSRSNELREAHKIMNTVCYSSDRLRPGAQRGAATAGFIASLKSDEVLFGVNMSFVFK